MNQISLERNIRSMFPILRLMQVYMPYRFSNWFLRQGVRRLRLAGEVSLDAVTADGVPCVWLTPNKSQANNALLYLHGGGFVYGLTPQHVQMAAHLAKRMGTRVLMVDYRLGPEYPFPAALDDCVVAYHWMMKQGIAANQVVVAGDSAGGNLTITMMMKLRDKGEQLPAAAACLSPVVDLSDQGNSVEGFKDPLLPLKARNIYRKSYLADNDARNPLISPAFGDWCGLPPLLIHVGEDEILRKDGIRAEELARAAGVGVRLEVYPRMWHVWQIFLQLPQATQSLEDIGTFLQSHLGE